MSEHATASYSQFGEDRVLAWIFPGTGAGFYVDVGCHHPFRFSNTATLHLERGWTGVNIDPDPRAIAAFREHRPHDVNLEMGIAAGEGEMAMAFFEEGALNTVQADHEIHPAFSAMPRERRTIRVSPLRTVIQSYLPPLGTATFLNIDAEGLDMQVLQGNGWSVFRPYCIAIEEQDLGLLDHPSESGAYNFLRSMGYRLISRCAITSLYVDLPY